MKQSIESRNNNRIPSYVSIYNQIYQDIVKGIYPKGSPLPGENQMAARYKVSRNTLRQALTVLTQDGYIYKRQGKGTFVCYDKEQRNFPGIYNYLLECTGEEIVQVKMDYNISLPTEIARSKLRLSQDQSVLASDNVYFTKTEAISHSFLQLPMDYLEKKQVDIHSEKALFRLMNESIYEDGANAEVWLQCIFPDDQTRPFLNLDKDMEKQVPLLYLEQVIYDLENIPIARVKYHFHMDKYKVKLGGLHGKKTNDTI